MPNQYVNKVIYGGNTLMDLTGDTVDASKILSGFTAHDASGAQITGSCAYDVDSTDATVSASEILATKTAYARGAKLTGTMTNRGGVTGTISTVSGSYTIQNGFHDGSGSVAIAAAEQAKLVAGNIKDGVSILGVTGSYSGSGGGGSGDGYTKAETDALLEDKADKILTYTKQEVDALIPSVPIKGIKANGTEITPNASGVVDIDTKDLLICTIRKQGDDWTIDKEESDIDEAFSEGKLVVADIYEGSSVTRVPFNGYAFVRISDDGTNTVVEWWSIITNTMIDPFTGDETYDGITIDYVTRTIPQSSGGGSASADVAIRCTADYDPEWEYPFRLILPNGMTYADIKDKIITFEVPLDGSIEVTGTEVHIWTGSYYIDDDIYLCLSPYSGASYNGILFGEGELASFLITEYNGQIYGLATNMSAKRYYQNIDDRINANIPEVPVKSISFNDTPVNPDAQGNVAINYAYTISSAEKEDIADMVQADMEAVELTGTLTAGQTSLTLSDEAISTNSIIDIYVDKWGVSPANVTTTTGSITMTFTAQASNMSVKVIVRNPDYDALAGVREEVYIGTVQPSASEGYKLWINPNDTPSSGGGSNLELLWTNSAATSASFAAQTISLDLSDYKAVEIVFLVKASYSSHISQSCFMDLTDRIFVGSYDDEVKFFDRIVKPTSTGVQFYDGANNGTTDNTVCVPRYIYGIK